jgi:hypothetical protein
MIFHFSEMMLIFIGTVCIWCPSVKNTVEFPKFADIGDHFMAAE